MWSCLLCVEDEALVFLWFCKFWDDNDGDDASDNVYGAVVMAATVRVHLMKTDWVSGGRNTKPTWAVSPLVDCYCPCPSSSFIINTHPKSWYSFYHPVEGWVDLCIPIRGVQPVPKAVYCSCRHDKHTTACGVIWNWDASHQSQTKLDRCSLQQEFTQGCIHHC